MNSVRDLWERSVLFWDTLRRRTDDMLEHERQGLPPLLDFDYELLLDAHYGIALDVRRPGREAAEQVEFAYRHAPP